MRVDLHSHSIFSDGTLSPTELITLASQKKLQAVALTDHDTLAGVAEEFEAARELKIQAISGIEFSTFSGCEVHIIGYGMDYRNLQLLSDVADLAALRKSRNAAIIAKLNASNIDITCDELYEINGESLGRTHIAKLLIKHGYAKSIQEAFDKWLAYGRPCYVSSQKITPVEAIKLISKHSGISVLAHPKQLALTNMQFESFLDSLIANGLNGLEAFYASHTSEDKMYYSSLCKERALIATVGSDFHGSNRIVSLGQVNEEVDESLIKILTNGIK